MKRNNELLAITHLSQLLDFVTGIGGLLVPLLIWIFKKDDIVGMDTHGRAIINFRLTMLLYLLISVPMVLFFGLGLLGFVVVGIFYVIFPILNAIKASNDESPQYPFTINFI